MQLFEIINELEKLAPPSLQESYDNSGLIVGDSKMNVTKAIVCLDSTEAVLDEAIAKKANLIIAHHPIVFTGLKSLTGKNYVERVVMKAIKHDIAIYAIHTNLDNVETGVNKAIANKIGLKNVRILSPKTELLSKLITFVPKENHQQVLTALFKAGAGNIGNYKEASFNSEGIGTFTPTGTANPTIGKLDKRELVEEMRVEVLVTNYTIDLVVEALIEAHPYEEVAYDLVPLKNPVNQVGSGMIGTLEQPVTTQKFLDQLCNIFHLRVIRHTELSKSTINTVAICGGSGSFLLKNAKRAKADIFITSDFKYHEFFDAENELIIADIGHYESEQFTIQLLVDELSKKFPNFAFLFTEVNTNPISYFIKN